MKPNQLFTTLSLATLIGFVPAAIAQSQPGPKLADNAALRYWSAFAQMQDTSVTPEQAKELQSVVDGSAPYSDPKYRDLVERNRRAVETLQRGATLSQCEWGLEYQLGAEAPVEYVRKALALGRLNVLYSFHQLATGNRSGGIRTLAAGIRFSHDLAGGGPLIAGLAAKSLLMSHLRAVDLAAQMQPLSAAEKTLLSGELNRIGSDGVDWLSTLQREFDVLARSGMPVPATVVDLYRKALQDAAQLPQLERAMSGAPQNVASVIPRPQRVIEQKRELSAKLQHCRALLN